MCEGSGGGHLSSSAEGGTAVQATGKEEAYDAHGGHRPCSSQKNGWGRDGGNMLRDAVFYGVGTAYLVWLWVTTLFVGNVLAFLSFLFIRPLHQVWHESFLDEMAKYGWGTIIDYIEHVGRLTPVFTGDLEALGAVDHPFHKGNKIVIGNHSTKGDPLALFLVGHRLNRIGNMRFMVKKVLLLFPVLGLAAYFLDFVFLSRTWTKDESAIRRVFRSMLEGTRKRLFWICLFPEGTRITPQKQRESQEYASSKGLPVLKHVLIPRVKGLQSTLVGLRSDVDAVLDVTIAYSIKRGETVNVGSSGNGHLSNKMSIRPDMFDFMLHRSSVRSWPIHIHVRIIPMSDIPSNEAGISEWALKVFKEKDTLLEHFNTHGCFPGAPNHLPKSSDGRMLLGFLIYSLAALMGGAVCWSLGSYLITYFGGVGASLSVVVGAYAVNIACIYNYFW